ncbi:MAG: leucine-rich repeat protein [Bacteroidota bacterium]
MNQEDQKPIREARKAITQARKNGSTSLSFTQGGLRELPVQIAQLPKLTHLYLWNCELHTLGPATQLTGLTHLYLSHNPIFGALGELAAFPQLTELSLDGCSIRSLGDLPILPRLEKINLSNNRITNLSQLGKFPALNRVILTDNSLTSLRPLRPLLERGIELYGKWSLGYSLADRYVYFKGNPLVDPPYAIAREGTKATLRYWDIHARASVAPKAEPAPATAPQKDVPVAVKKAKGLINEDRLREAIGTLKPFLVHPELLEGRLQELENEVVEGVLSPGEASLRRARIRKAILLAADKLPQ